MADIQLNDELAIPASELQWSYSRSAGPGGQNVNKLNTKATLRWQPAIDRFSPTAWQRFQRIAKRYLTIDGCVVIQSQEHRDRAQNIAACRDKLREMVLDALKTPKRRRATQPTRASKRRRLDDKRRTGDKKDSRRWSE